VNQIKKFVDGPTQMSRRRRPSSSVWYRGGLPGQEKETAENDDDDEDEKDF
jgi:hypothetical protein